MERLAILEKKDVKTAHSFVRVLKLLGISEEDLLLLKDIKKMKEHIETLRDEIHSLEVGLGITSKRNNLEAMFNVEEGEHLKDE